MSIPVFTSKVINSEYPLETEIPDHLKELYSTSCQELDDEQQIKLRDLLIKYQDMFSASSHDLGRTSLVKHKVDLLNIDLNVCLSLNSKLPRMS